MKQPLATLLVGDTVSDVATARTLGWRFLGVGTGAGAVQLARAGAKIIVPHFADLNAGMLVTRSYGAGRLAGPTS